ncbi:NADH-ubiquinone oxidoreductase subunit, mitochondrial [Sphaceloma murrayae]|uniref:NADH-ubiquinone oxidoreductase subunit, mitochondrial n=1 Tax=Sphaceloma murrayae TaxID=2082308 RepID=A0A2K1QP07_9PEZI|nr:NADH-ubiquinone oxidoreductase subunit, mitochondrial [Sphaceloma murrayae]
MDDPVSEIAPLIYALTTTPPSLQLATIERFFTPTATFIHPFCRTPISPSSRWQIARIYRWYKIMSPQISIKVHSVAFDEENSILYAGITQVFAVWFVPFHRSEVSLVTVLHLERRGESEGEGEGEGAVASGGKSGGSSLVDLDLDGGSGGKWYITRQNDLYQTDQFMRFVVPHLAWLVEAWQVLATWACVLASYVFVPVTWWEDSRQQKFTRREKPPAFNDGTGKRGLGS